MVTGELYAGKRDAKFKGKGVRKFTRVD